MPLRQLTTSLVGLLAALVVTIPAARAQCPPAPTILTCTSFAPCEITIVWSFAASANGAIIYRNTSPDLASATQIGIAAGISYTDTAAPPNTPLWYWVRSTTTVTALCATGLGGISPASTAVSTVTAPAGVVNPFFLPGCQSGQLSWDPPATGPAPTHYDILDGFLPDPGLAQLLTTVPATSGRMSTVISSFPGALLWIRPMNGCVAGPLSPALLCTNSVVAPETPLNPAATRDRCDGIRVTWSPPLGLSSASSYTVRWTSNPVSTSWQTATVSGSVTSFLIGSATVNTNYRITVTASNLCGDGPATSELTGVRTSSVGFDTHPASVLAAPGSTAQFSAAANIPNSTYQWRRNGVPLASGGRVSGVNTSQLTLTNIRPEDAANYDVVATNPICGFAGASSPAVLGVAIACQADFNHSGALTVQDLFDFLAAYFAGCP